jgi:hypothetical protein
MNEAVSSRLILLRKAYEALFNEPKADVQKPVRSDDPKHIQWNPDQDTHEHKPELAEVEPVDPC